MDNLQPPGDSIDGEIKTGLNEDTLSSSVDLSIASEKNIANVAII